MSGAPGQTLYRWRAAGGLREAAPGPDPAEAGSLLVADSWRVAAGRARALDLHHGRFRRACAARLGAGHPLLAELAPFWNAALSALPRTGDWFPRLELVSGAEDAPALQLRLRSSPPPGQAVRLWPYPGADRRRRPRLKGPDLAWLSGLRARARAHGCDDALLVTTAGFVIETATAHLLWWEPGPAGAATLCVPPPALRLLDGVTTALVQAEARRRGVAVRHRLCRPEGLRGREVWTANALHGIRPVLGWDGGEAGPAPRAPDWRDWLADLARSLEDFTLPD